MQVFIHHIYEYKKGLRNLVLHTMSADNLEKAERMLNRHEIEYHIQRVSERKINIFFGKEQCIKIIKSFGDLALNEYSDEEDFILGIMLGYDTTLQCERYLKRKGKKKISTKKLVNIQ